MRVSVLFCCYNQQAFVREALQAALTQDYPGYELVVADDGSSDGTRQVVDEVLRMAPAHVRVVRADSPVNRGLVASFNQAVAASSGEILVPMAGDDISERDRLGALVQVFRGRPTVHLVCSNVRKIDAAGRELADAYFLPDEGREYAYPAAGRIRSLYANLPMVGATAAYRRTLFDVFGPLGPEAPSEDNCLTVRALLLGPAVYLADRLVRWRRHGANLSTHEFGRAEDARDRERHLNEYWRQVRTMRQVQADLRAPALTGRAAPELLARVGAGARQHGARQSLRHASLAPSTWSDWASSVGRLPWRDRLTMTPLMFLRRALPPFRWLHWKMLSDKLNRAA